MKVMIYNKLKNVIYYGVKYKRFNIIYVVNSVGKARHVIDFKCPKCSNHLGLKEEISENLTRLELMKMTKLELLLCCACVSDIKFGAEL